MGPFYPLLSILEDGLALVPSNSEDYEDQSVVNYLNLCRISSLWPSIEKKSSLSWISSIVACHSELNCFLLAALGVVYPVISIIFLFIIRRHYKKKSASSNLLARNIFSDPSSRSDVEGGSVYFGVTVFSYSELEEATNSFDIEKELGDGGFGTVYHGKMTNSLILFQYHLNYSINFESKRL